MEVDNTQLKIGDIIVVYARKTSLMSGPSRTGKFLYKSLPLWEAWDFTRGAETVFLVTELPIEWSLQSMEIMTDKGKLLIHKRRTAEVLFKADVI